MHFAVQLFGNRHRRGVTLSSKRTDYHISQVRMLPSRALLIGAVLYLHHLNCLNFTRSSITVNIYLSFTTRRSVFSSGANMTEQINEESCAYLLV